MKYYLQNKMHCSNNLDLSHLNKLLLRLEYQNFKLYSQRIVGTQRKCSNDVKVRSR